MEIHQKQPKTFLNRYVIIAIAFMVIMLLLIVRLFYLQFFMADTYRASSDATKTVTLRTVGQRGAIYDCNGVPLAYNQQSYTIEFVRDPDKRNEASRREYSQVLNRVVDIVERHDGTTVASFPIRKQEDGSFAFEWGDVSEETALKKKNRWLSDMAIDKKRQEGSAEELYNYLVSYYCLPEDISYEKQIKLLSIWQEVQFTSYQSYLAVTIAENVNMDTVAEIEIYASELPGVSVGTTSSRVYPKQSLAAHILGYTGKITDEDTLMQVMDLGYKRTDMIGISGVESSMEFELSPNLTERSGESIVEVNNRGKVKSTVSTISPSDGNSVTLTIDSDFQAVVEQALAENIQQIHDKQVAAYRANSDAYDKDLEDINLASVGALVVMNAQTAEVLACASYPSFDPNIFTGGLSVEEYATIRNDTRNPLFNNAIASRGTPGSIFKMATGLAGLMEQVVTVDEHIDDKGPYNKYVQSGHVASCWVRPNFDKHTNQNLANALKNSCNYYFFEVADRLGIDRLNKWASQLGLDSLTGIELPGEKVGQIGCQQSLYNTDNPPSGTSYLIYKYIRNLLVEANTALGREFDDETYDTTTLKLMALIDLSGQLGPDIRGILISDMNFTQQEIRRFMLDSEISSRLSEIRWDPNDTILTGIGQSVTLVTPIAVARYVAALVNGGNVYEARLVKSITTPEGQVTETVPQLVRNIGADAEYLKSIKEGMREVVSLEDGGTAGEAFRDFKYRDMIGGKTGSAQVSNIDLETNSWFVAFAPFEQPEIVVVAYIPNGMGGSNSAPAIMKVIEYYLDNKNATKGFAQVPQANTVLP